MSKHEPVQFERLLYARNIAYYDLIAMEDSVQACHKLWNKHLPMWDQLYMLKAIQYGELQRAYAN